ncbi:hypothetical protein, partial [Oceanobacillus oncorhynchi]|uniref:hypothetical protein n=1 Tax=Oceanobacillus oncorhynchi TaxID=545501 RepID=UPI001D00FEBB
CQRDVRSGKSLSAGNVQPHGKKTASCSGLPVAFPAGVDNIRSHLSGIMFYLLFFQGNNANSSDGFDGTGNRNGFQWDE